MQPTPGRGVLASADVAGILAVGHGGWIDPLALVLGMAGLGSTAVVALALVALARRRSWSYFLVAAALGTLLARTSLGALSMAGVVTFETHHLPEHALDVLLIALLLGAIYAARTAPDGVGSGDTREGGELDE